MFKSRGRPHADFLIFVDADIGADVYFQYLRMRMWMQMLKIMRILQLQWRISSPPVLEVDRMLIS